MAETSSSSRLWSSRPLPALPPVLPLQQHLLTISASAIKVGDESDVRKITDVFYTASYNWLAGDKPTVLVPALNQDKGTYFRDKNASKHAAYPTEPAVRAIYTMKPEYNGQQVDIFACSNTMGPLLAFALEQNKTYRSVAEKVGNTLFLIRKEKSSCETIPNVCCYGHTVPEAYTNWDPACVGSQSHQRLVSNTFGDLSLVVKPETDEYLPHCWKMIIRPNGLETTTSLEMTWKLLPFPNDNASSTTNPTTLRVIRA
ncbi:hypothetical protein H2200_007906 [Cladophialophora chaetospira]|uniref:Uncharacterized protein n=1 Tax=Cladophialophora chaetospira TaxID=386627 RepID=A0AA39CGX2_9EURO|nr:hypothetical protein H2200_007906 [Cladophialophora chaetospira]